MVFLILNEQLLKDASQPLPKDSMSIPSRIACERKESLPLALELLLKQGF